MPDAWESDNELDRDDPADALLDADADGCTNLHEYLAGTDPNDAASGLKLTVTAQGSGVLLLFPVVTGRSHTVQRRDDPSVNPWTKLQHFPPSQSNGFAETTDSSPTSSPQRIDRVVTPSL